MNPVQYIIINKSLSMSTGKAAAQAAHASQLGLLTHVENDTRESPYNKSIVNRWMRGGHYAKVVLEADDLSVAERYLNDRGFKTALIIDEGRTEIEALSPTAIGTGVVDKDIPHVRETFSTFKLYTDSNPSDPGAGLDFSQPMMAERTEWLDENDVASDWLTEGAKRRAAMTTDVTHGDTFNENEDKQSFVRRIFKNTRKAIGEEPVPDEEFVEPPFPWPPTVRQT